MAEHAVIFCRDNVTPQAEDRFVYARKAHPDTGSKNGRRTHRPQSASLLPSCCLHSMPCLFRSITSGPAASMIMEKIPKHQPRPAPSASGCCDAMAAPAPMHLTMLYDAWTVADALGFKSVSSVPQSYRSACQRRKPYKCFGPWVTGRLTVKMLEVAAPLMNCIIRGMEMCYVGRVSSVLIFENKSPTGQISHPHRSFHQTDAVASSAHGTQPNQSISPNKAGFFDGKVGYIIASSVLPVSSHLGRDLSDVSVQEPPYRLISICPIVRRSEQSLPVV